MTIRQKTKLRNAFNNNMSTDLKLSKAQISKIIQSGGFLGSLLSKLAVPLMEVAIPLLLSLDWIDIGLDRYWIALFCNRNEIVFFESSGVQHVPREIKEFIGTTNIKANICQVEANDSVMCGYFCIGFIEFMLAGKKLTDYTSLISPHGFKKNDDIILSYFKDE